MNYTTLLSTMYGLRARVVKALRGMLYPRVPDAIRKKVALTGLTGCVADSV